MKILCTIILSMFIIPNYLLGGFFSSSEEEPEAHWIDGAPFFDAAESIGNTINFEFSTNFIPSTKFSKPTEVRGEHLTYFEGNTTLAYTFFVNPCEALTAGVGYSWDRVHWKNNPYFDDSNFQRCDFDLYAATYRIPGWIWRAGFALSFDANHWDLSQYALYKYSLWGRYSCGFECFPDLGLHIGITGRAGIEKEWQQPIFGVDFPFFERWMVRLIYPIDLSIAYQWSDQLFFDFAYRSWNRRYRLDREEALSRGIFEYRNSGLEIGSYYKYNEFILARAHIGHTFNRGELVIHDHNDVNVGHQRLNSSFYLGGELALSF